MRISIIAPCAALAALALAGPAAAQRGASLTLYEGVNFTGPSRSFSSGIDNLADQGFNDRAQSARVQGRWRLCEDSRMRGRCVDVTGDIPNLADLRLTVAVSSFEVTGGGGGFPGGGFPGDGGGYPGGGGYGGGPRPNPGQGLEGRSASFFPNPPPGAYRGADEFCRRLGFSGVIYADDRGQLRDVLCRR